MSKPRIAVTIGDIAGIGPEIVFKAANSLQVQRVCRPVIFTDGGAVPFLFNGGMRTIGEGASCREISFKSFDVVISSNVGKINAGRPSKKSGVAAASAIEQAVKYCLSKKAQALATAPVSKESFKLAGIKHPGHTEFLAALTKSKNPAMLMICGNICSVMVTRHIPLSEISKQLKTKDIISTVKSAAEFIFSKNGEKKVPIAICALNPHAGDNGILGFEEKRIISPAVKILRRQGYNVSSPLPADAAWLKTINGEFSLIVGMYHDQIMIPLKVVNAKKIVNATAGLPFVRTSPGHGAAFDIAGQNKASPSAMIESILYAAKNR